MSQDQAFISGKERMLLENTAEAVPGRSTSSERRAQEPGQPSPTTPGRYKEWLDVFDAYGVQFLVLDALRDSRLLQLIRASADWTVDFSDGESVLLTRSQELATAQGAAQ